MFLDDKIHRSRRNTWQREKASVMFRHPITGPSCSHRLHTSGQFICELTRETATRQTLIYIYMYVQSLTAFMGLWSSQRLLLQLSTGPEHKCYSILKNDTCHVLVIWVIKYQLNLFLKTYSCKH